MKFLVTLVLAFAVCAVLGLLLLQETARRHDLEQEMARIKVATAVTEAKLHAEQANAAARDAAIAEARSRAAPTRRPAPAPAADQPALAHGLTAVSALHDTGRATARDSFSTQVWASAAGNIDAAAAALTFSPEGRALLEQALKDLPPDLAAQYNTPEKLMAYALAGSPHPMGGIEVTGETPVDDHDVSLHVTWQHADDDIVHNNDLLFRQDATGQWQQVVPVSLVRRAVSYLTRR